MKQNIKELYWFVCNLKYEVSDLYVEKTTGSPFAKSVIVGEMKEDFMEVQEYFNG